MSLRRRIARSRRGGYDLRLPAGERALLAALPGQLEHLLGELGGEGEAPPEALRRLFPVAYTRDELAEATYEAVARGELIEHHREALAVLARTSGADHLDEEQAASWLAALNDLRLVLGTSLGVTEEAVAPDESDPAFSDWVYYGYLSYLQGELVDALEGALPPPVPGADDEVPEDPWGEPPGDLRWDGTQRPAGP